MMMKHKLVLPAMVLLAATGTALAQGNPQSQEVRPAGHSNEVVLKILVESEGGTHNGAEPFMAQQPSMHQGGNRQGQPFRQQPAAGAQTRQSARPMPAQYPAHMMPAEQPDGFAQGRRIQQRCNPPFMAGQGAVSMRDESQTPPAGPRKQQLRKQPSPPANNVQYLRTEAGDVTLMIEVVSADNAQEQTGRGHVRFDHRQENGKRQGRGLTPENPRQREGDDSTAMPRPRRSHTQQQSANGQREGGAQTIRIRLGDGDAAPQPPASGQYSQQDS